MRLKLVLAHKAQGCLLDIGSGGDGFLELASSSFDARSIDISPYAAAKLPTTLRDRITVGDIERVDLPGQTYDVVTAFNVLEHLRRPSRVIHKISDALAPEGVFVGSVPCNAGWIGSLYTPITNYFDRTHRSTYRFPTWRKAFGKAAHLDTRFFGEFMIDGIICTYIFAPLWRYISFNMMFVSRKLSTSTPA
jgi:SAM-dependent methyltransferase